MTGFNEVCMRMQEEYIAGIEGLNQRLTELRELAGKHQKYTSAWYCLKYRIKSLRDIRKEMTDTLVVLQKRKAFECAVCSCEGEAARSSILGGLEKPQC